MKSADIGFTGSGPNLTHAPDLTEFEAWSLDVIRVWCQRGAPIPAETLADFLFITGRQVRRLVNHLIDRRYHGLPVYPVPGNSGGYFLPEHEALKDRAASSVSAQLQRARTSAVKARDLGATVQELTANVVQLSLDLGTEVHAQVVRSLAPQRGPATQSQVRRALARYARDPRQFAAEIDELRQQFGGLFVRREDLVRAMRQHSERVIEQTLAEIAGRA